MSSCAFQRGYDRGLVEGNETFLRSHLTEMRESIKRYAAERGHPPQSLNELVDTGYLTHIPSDPITSNIDWIVIYYDCSLSPNCKPGIKDVHSASDAKSTQGSRYSEW